MATTNAQLVAINTAELVLSGILDPGDVIHTYQGWKSRGYQVQKGEKAIAKFSIWKYVTRKKKDGSEEQKMFLKNSAWFTQKQVSKI